jgi:bifunctional DNA-binding transcriptional regulator/antitoxin component of YhaV-PrlF toxin-antitoxin module
MPPVQGAYVRSLTRFTPLDLLHAMTTTVTGKNQITVPAAIVARYALRPGTRIEWISGPSDDEFRCRVVPDPAVLAQRLRGAGRRHMKPGKEHPLEALRRDREAE